MSTATDKPAEFDQFAGDYDQALSQGISVSGEDKNYFARGRMTWTAKRLAALGETPRSVMDFGCGTGSATPFFYERWPHLAAVLGTDISPASLEVARREHGSDRTRFALMNDYTPDASFDLVFCNGVFHHIPLDQRAGAMRYVYNALRPGGLLALWENNPWNPGTRYVMSKIPFDRDAITLSPPECKRLTRAAGFEVLHTDFRFYCPRLLAWFRPLERALVKVPMGTQFLVLARKPEKR